MLHRLLDALAGRTEPSNVKGTILVDGERPPSNYKFMTGYVVQVTLSGGDDSDRCSSAGS